MADLLGGTTGQVLSKASNTDMDFSWVAADDTNAIQNAIVDAKGDLIAASAADTPARLAVGNNGETLVADSSTSTGLRYQTGVNVNNIINGGFDFFQRGTSSSTSGWTCADRWYNIVGGTTTFSQDTSVPTAAGVQYSYKWTTGASSSYGQFYTALDSATVKPLRGQAMAFSFWVKATGTAFSGVLNADAAYSNSTDAYASQATGVTITGGANITPTSTWTRYTGTLTIPSDAVGLKIGVVPTSVQASGVVVYLAAVQLELGSVATTFKRAGGTIQGELAACQRYYFRTLTGNAYGRVSQYGNATGATNFVSWVQPPVPMRVIPTAIEFSSALGAGDGVALVAAISAITLDGQTNNNYVGFSCTTSGLTTYRGYNIIGNASTTSYIAATAEL
jgi:hypothetical protein